MWFLTIWKIEDKDFMGMNMIFAYQSEMLFLCCWKVLLVFHRGYRLFLTLHRCIVWSKMFNNCPNSGIKLHDLNWNAYQFTETLTVAFATKINEAGVYCLFYCKTTYLLSLPLGECLYRSIGSCWSGSLGL